MDGWMGGELEDRRGVPRGGESNKSACLLCADMGLVCEGCVFVCVCVEGITTTAQPCLAVSHLHTGQATYSHASRRPSLPFIHQFFCAQFWQADYLRLIFFLQSFGCQVFPKVGVCIIDIKCFLSKVTSFKCMVCDNCLSRQSSRPLQVSHQERSTNTNANKSSLRH